MTAHGHGNSVDSFHYHSTKFNRKDTYADADAAEAIIAHTIKYDTLTHIEIDKMLSLDTGASLSLALFLFCTIILSYQSWTN